MSSLPVGHGSSVSSLWSRLQESISKQSFDNPLYRFNIPNLRVGTLDSLLSRITPSIEDEGQLQ
ncbi:hypothetical protein CASFOL_029229 [Castilleja foliolosa]|uniref:V-type proton ATPase subunit C n=1 Tax=Castilleja foliolosa TaxID=1961234 RepID=A0ABD3CAU6_9LAMI